MSVDRDLFSTAPGADQAELKAHAALYAAREDGTDQAIPVVFQEVTARPRPLPQRGAAVARSMREKLVAEREQLVSAARRARTGADGGVPSASILRFRLADLPRLTGATRAKRPAGTDDGSGGQR